MTTAVTLLVLAGILVVGLLLGARGLFAPLPDTTDTGPKTAAPCAKQSVAKGQRVTTRQVQVSVYNGGNRAGLADETMSALTKRGFRKGKIGNAPEGAGIKRAQVWTTRRNDPGARLAAAQFGKGTRVFFKDVDLGPGVDVLVGDDFSKLGPTTRAVVAKRAFSVCRKGKAG